MTSFISVFLFAFALACASAEFKQENGVLVLTDGDIDDAIKAHEFILIEFYAPWCGHCKRLTPEYEKAAEMLASTGSTVALAKVDATEEKESGSRFGVRGYPTIKWFVNGKDSEFNGDRTAAGIVQWIKKKTGTPTKSLATKEDLETFKNGADVVVVAFLVADSEEYKAFETASRASEEIEFGYSTDSDLAAAHGVSIPSLVVFKKFDDGKAVFDAAFETAAISSFVSGNSLPLISTFSQESASKIFGSGIETHFLYFNDATNSEHENTLAQLRLVAPEFLGKTLFVFVPASEDRVMSYFDFKATDLPKAILVSLGSGDMKKFGFDKEITAENVRAHVGAFHAGDLKPTLKSEEVPADNSGPVTTLVGKNFNEIVLDTTKDVLVEFYAPWCGHCKSLVPTYDQLGAKYANVESIVIAKIDSTANDIEHSGVHVEGFPTIYFFPANNKAAPSRYEGARELEAFIEYIEEHATTLKSGAEGAKHVHEHEDL